MLSVSEDFNREVVRVYDLATDTVDIESSTFYLDEDGSIIMKTKESDNGSIDFDFMLSDRHFNVLEGVIHEL